MIKRKDGFNGQRALILPQMIVQQMEDNAVSSILHITDIGYYPKAQFHFRERTEPISQYVFIYCTEGRGWYSVNGKRYEVGADQYFILPAGTPHAYGTDPVHQWTIYWIHFKGAFAEHFTTQNNEPITLKPSSSSRISDRIELFEEIFRTLEMGYGIENTLYACSTFYHFLGSLRYRQQFQQAKQNKAPDNDVISASVHFMQENIEKRLTIKEIAQHTGYSTSHLSAIFTQRTGYAPLSYFNHLKIRRACELLDFTDMRINQICFKIGIEDTYYFSRLFSKVMGMSPREYRAMKKG